MNRVIFTLSTGRCGTKYLYKVLNTVPGVVAAHEPDPNFVAAWKLSKEQRLKWLKKTKLPKLPKVPIYVETSHLVNLGFIELLLELDFKFEVIWLTRNLKEVALSYYRAGTIPGRTAVGRNYCPAPDHPDNVLYYKDYSGWSNYTLCRWIACEKNARNAAYADALDAAGVPVVGIDLTALATPSGFLHLLDRLDLPGPDEAEYADLAYIRANATPAAKLEIEPPTDEDEAPLYRSWYGKRSEIDEANRSVPTP